MTELDLDVGQMYAYNHDGYKVRLLSHIVDRVEISPVEKNMLILFCSRFSYKDYRDEETPVTHDPPKRHVISRDRFETICCTPMDKEVPMKDDERGGVWGTVLSILSMIGLISNQVLDLDKVCELVNKRIEFWLKYDTNPEKCNEDIFEKGLDQLCSLGVDVVNENEKEENTTYKSGKKKQFDEIEMVIDNMIKGKLKYQSFWSIPSAALKKFGLKIPEYMDKGIDKWTRSDVKKWSSRWYPDRLGFDKRSLWECLLIWETIFERKIVGNGDDLMNFFKYIIENQLVVMGKMGIFKPTIGAHRNTIELFKEMENYSKNSPKEWKKMLMRHYSQAKVLKRVRKKKSVGKIKEWAVSFHRELHKDEKMVEDQLNSLKKEMTEVTSKVWFVKKYLLQKLDVGEGGKTLFMKLFFSSSSSSSKGLEVVASVAKRIATFGAFHVGVSIRNQKLHWVNGSIVIIDDTEREKQDKDKMSYLAGDLLGSNGIELNSTEIQMFLDIIEDFVLANNMLTYNTQTNSCQNFVGRYFTLIAWIFGENVFHSCFDLHKEGFYNEEVRVHLNRVIAKQQRIFVCDDEFKKNFPKVKKKEWVFKNHLQLCEFSELLDDLNKLKSHEMWILKGFDRSFVLDETRKKGNCKFCPSIVKK